MRASIANNLFGLRDEYFKVIRIVANLGNSVINDNRTSYHVWIFEQEINELAYLHRIEINFAFQNDLASWGDDIIGAIIAFRNYF